MANYVKFMRGTPKAYEALLKGPQKPNADTLYFIYENDAADAILYLGERLIAGGSSSVSKITLGSLDDIALNPDLEHKSILVYDKTQKKWINSTVQEAISVFVGATVNAAGVAGLVPAPALGATNLYLRSDGTWAPIAAESRSNVWIVENEDTTQMHEDIIDNATQDVLLNVGDIIIVKDYIANDKWQHTSYVYTGAVWAAMDGNYNAENVYFDEDFIFTKEIGTVTIPSSGSKTVAAEGKNIREFFAGLFAQEVEPTRTLPSISFSKPNSETKEAGTKITPAYSIDTNKGSYTYNSDTGVTFTGYAVTDSLGRTATTKSGSMPEFQVEDGKTYTISATATYSDGIVPSTNIGNACEELQIKAGTTEKATSNSIKSYRKSFGGMDATGASLNSAWVRENLTAILGTSGSGEITWKAADKAGVKRYILMLPVGGGKILKSAIITSSMNADATADYIKQPNVVTVEGANGYTAVDYNVWIYEPASIASTEVHKLTIG